MATRLSAQGTQPIGQAKRCSPRVTSTSILVPLATKFVAWVPYLPLIASSDPFAPASTSDTFFTSSFISLVASSRVLADFSWPRPPRLASLSACRTRAQTLMLGLCVHTPMCYHPAHTSQCAQVSSMDVQVGNNTDPQGCTGTSLCCAEGASADGIANIHR